MSNTCIIQVRRGALHFAPEVYERFFRGLNSVILLRDGDRLVILPVRHLAGGGYVIKLRTGNGDRVVAAADFFRDNGIDDDVELRLPAQWSEAHSALIVPAAFQQQT